jgi:hypothetical protein
MTTRYYTTETRCRIDDPRRFYAALELLGEKIGGARRLAECSGRLLSPKRGVYSSWRTMSIDRTANAAAELFVLVLTR